MIIYNPQTTHTTITYNPVPRLSKRKHRGGGVPSSVGEAGHAAKCVKSRRKGRSQFLHGGKERDFDAAVRGNLSKHCDRTQCGGISGASSASTASSTRGLYIKVEECIRCQEHLDGNQKKMQQEFNERTQMSSRRPLLATPVSENEKNGAVRQTSADGQALTVRQTSCQN
jgi:hypothetical protein